MANTVEKKKIFYLITSTNVGGTERALYELVKRIDSREFSLSVCSIKKPGAFADKIAGEVEAFYTLGLPEAGGLCAVLNFFPALLRLSAILRKSRPHILHAFLFRANMLGRLAGRLAGVPRIISSVRIIEPGKRYKHMLDRLTAGLVDRYTAVSEAARMVTMTQSKVRPEKIVTIYNGVDIALIKASANNPSRQIEDAGKKIGLVGRFDKQKGHAILLAALKRIAGQVPGVRAYFFGEGPLETEIRNAAAREGLAERVRFMGTLDTIHSMIARMDIIALPSLWEGMPNAVLEAMALEKPVIASRLPGMDELLVDGESGILCTPGDAGELAEGLLRLLQADGPGAKIGKKAGERAKDLFSIDTTVSRTVALYREMLLQ